MHFLLVEMMKKIMVNFFVFENVKKFLSVFLLCAENIKKPLSLFYLFENIKKIVSFFVFEKM